MAGLLDLEKDIMGIEQNNYRVSVPGQPILTRNFISQEHAQRAAVQYRELGHRVLIEQIGPPFGIGLYEDWDDRNVC